MTLGAMKLFAIEGAIRNKRMIGGNLALQGDWPYVVSLQVYTETVFLWQKFPYYQHFCGGTIVDTGKKILTAGEFIV